MSAESSCDMPTIGFMPAWVSGSLIALTSVACSLSETHANRRINPTIDTVAAAAASGNTCLPLPIAVSQRRSALGAQPNRSAVANL